MSSGTRRLPSRPCSATAPRLRPLRDPGAPLRGRPPPDLGSSALVKEHRQDIGPWAIAGGIALAAAACLVWMIRKAAPFSWGEVPSPNVAFDYVLLLGLLLFASGLAYIEVEFALLGPRWPHHLLVVGGVYLLGAYLWDSRTILGLALTTGRVAGRLHQFDPWVARGGRRGQPARQRRRARCALRGGRRALRPAAARRPTSRRSSPMRGSSCS